jgi:3-oxoacyl-[acyl-carrier-protein] synthase-1
MRRVVITGAGIYSSIGKSLDEVKHSLLQGKSGIIFDPERKKMGYRSGLTGFVERPNLKGLVDRRSRMNMPEQAEYAYMSTIEAFKNAAIDESFLASRDVGIIFGNDSSSKPIVDALDIFREKKDSMLIGSSSIFQAMNSTVSMNLATVFKLKGANFTISSACASGSHAIGLAYLLISQGLQDVILAGGAQETNPYTFFTFDALSAFSIREEEPEKASRPFDKNRDGLVPSGGAASLVIESLESAIARNAQILGEIIGFGFSSNGDHISQSNIEGPNRSIDMAMKMAGIKSNEIGYVNAHATSTPNGDAREAQAIIKSFGLDCPPVSSTKSMTGHECWMAGASEIVYSLIMMHNNFIAANINFVEPDEFTKDLPIVKETMNKKFNVFLSNSFGFGGTNSTLIVRKFIK